ncbi:hypothetical protein, partial [Pseudonocardia alni]|uniref:hypothetical protein n=1 Tax=Pseudonocardia alni TaxID=33907 RepID=UPI001AD70C18
MNEDRPPRWVDRLRSAHPAAALVVAAVPADTPTVPTVATGAPLPDRSRPPAAALLLVAVAPSESTRPRPAGDVVPRRRRRRAGVANPASGGSGRGRGGR